MSEQRYDWVKGVDGKWHRSDSWDRECCKVSKYLGKGTKLYELELYHNDDICPDCLEYTLDQEKI